MTGESVSKKDPPSRPWIILPTAVLAVLALAWSGFWYFASTRAQSTMTAWRAREADAGRTYGCANASFGGYPFRIEVNCADPSVADRASATAVSARSLAAVAQVWDPDLVIAEIQGPLTVATLAGAPTATVDWALAQASLRGAPRAPERLSIVVEKPTLVAAPANAPDPVAKAEHLEFHARFAPESAPGHPVIDLALDVTSFTAPALVRLGPPLATLAGAPTDAAIVAVLRGTSDLAPKPLAQQLRDIEAADGRLEIANARLQHGDVIATLSGAAALTARGTLNGEFHLVVVNFAGLVPLLGIDRAVAQMVPQDTLGRLAPNLDRLLPGLGGMLRGGNSGAGGSSASANAAAAALGAAALGGRDTELEGQRAVALTLRIDDGVVSLGPLKVAEIPPLF
jgi:hypothetical protein